MRSTYRVLAYLVIVGVMLQAAFIAFAFFSIDHAVDGGKTIDKNYDNAGFDLHGIGGLVVAVIALALLIVSFFARVPGGRKWAGIVFGLVVLQFVLGFAGFAAAIVGSLHGINAMVLLVAAYLAAHRVRVADVATPAPTLTTTTTAA
jgi:heme A synthase